MLSEGNFNIELLFAEIEDSTIFEYRGDFYRKEAPSYTPVYGWVNAQLLERRFYPGDTGQRKIYTTSAVRITPMRNKGVLSCL